MAHEAYGSPRISRSIQDVALQKYKEIRLLFKQQSSSATWSDAVKEARKPWAKPHPEEVLKPLLSSSPLTSVSSNELTATIKLTTTLDPLGSGTSNLEEEVILGYSKRRRKVLKGRACSLPTEIAASPGRSRQLQAPKAIPADFDQNRENASCQEGENPFSLKSNADNHIAVLVAAWCYVLAKSWAEWVGGVSEAKGDPAPYIQKQNMITNREAAQNYVFVSEGEQKDIWWWRQICNGKSFVNYVNVEKVPYYSPWDIDFAVLKGVVVAGALESSVESTFDPPGAEEAVRILRNYVIANGLQEQFLVARELALWLPSVLQYGNEVVIARPLHSTDLLAGTMETKTEISSEIANDLLERILEALLRRKFLLCATIAERSRNVIEAAAVLQAFQDHWPVSAESESAVLQALSRDGWPSVSCFAFSGGSPWWLQYVSDLSISDSQQGGIVAAGVWNMRSNWIYSPFECRGVVASDSEEMHPESSICRGDEIILHQYLGQTQSQESLEILGEPLGQTSLALLPTTFRSYLRKVVAAKNAVFRVKVKSIGWHKTGGQNATVEITDADDEAEQCVNVLKKNRELVEEFFEIAKGGAINAYSITAPDRRVMDWHENDSLMASVEWAKDQGRMSQDEQLEGIQLDAIAEETPETTARNIGQSDHLACLSEKALVMHDANSLNEDAMISEPESNIKRWLEGY
eukprot:Plantae.Rhodophyta-Hildenbrandia_rubra.ctg7231.p1 GENE.Plantae.Rhodophyta-Hildenbrandia_rubra.ctg7231~~Plantae.Rhodophyta-Hildenbrandia_rubra.ctg7231.p1  ORF type:complete len:693 (-),score=99.01 Plantae.Rhodophyta-Hildenbrandia_rubra.ctg7231:1216-3294(-)